MSAYVLCFSPSASTSYLTLVTSSTPSSEVSVSGVSLPDLISPTLADILPDICRNKLTPTSLKPVTPTGLKPPPILLPTKPVSSLSSPVSALPSIVEKLAALPPLMLKPNINTSVSSNNVQPADLSISIRPPLGLEKKPRPPSLQLGPLPLSNGNIINKVVYSITSLVFTHIYCTFRKWRDWTAFLRV